MVEDSLYERYFGTDFRPIVNVGLSEEANQCFLLDYVAVSTYHEWRSDERTFDPRIEESPQYSHEEDKCNWVL